MTTDPTTPAPAAVETCASCGHLWRYHDDKGCSVWSCINDRQYCECSAPNPGNVSTYDDEVDDGIV